MQNILRNTWKQYHGKKKVIPKYKAIRNSKNSTQKDLANTEHKMYKYFYNTNKFYGHTKSQCYKNYKISAKTF